MSAAIKLSLPLGLLVVYVVGALIWYELLRAELVDLLGRRRRGRGRRSRRRGERDGEHVQNGGGELGLDDVDGATEDEPRMHYYLARKAAVAERDAAVAAAEQATEQAIERIERRYGRAGSGAGGREGNAAKMERDAAVEAANEAARQAIERIERRYREIDWALEDEEEERIREMLEAAER